MQNKMLILTESDLHKIVEDTLYNYKKKELERYNEYLEEWNKEYQLFKTTGNVNKEYLEKLFRDEKNIIETLINNCKL